MILVLENQIQVKKAAVDIVRDLTGAEDGLQSLAKYSDIALPSLFRLLAEKKVIFLNYYFCLLADKQISKIISFFP